MKKILFILVTAIMPYVQAYTQTNVLNTTGNVGIGTISPVYNLHVKGSTDFQLKTESSGGFAGLTMSSSTTTKQFGFLFGSDGVSGHGTNDVRFGKYSTGSWETNPVLFDLDAPNSALTLSEEGKVGIGTLAPSESLTIAGPNGDIFIGHTLLTGYNGMWLNGSAMPLDYNFLSSASDKNLYINRPVGGIICFRQANVDQMTITNSGNVGIGTAAPGSYKLAVEGVVGARKIKVTQIPWADYVFHPSYRLPPLYEVEAYIKQHQHLPEIPSAAEVEKNGLDLGDNQAALLKKIEELTLYAIEQNKNIELQRKQIEALILCTSKQKNEMDELKKTLKALPEGR